MNKESEFYQFELRNKLAHVSQLKHNLHFRLCIIYVVQRSLGEVVIFIFLLTTDSAIQRHFVKR